MTTTSTVAASSTSAAANLSGKVTQVQQYVALGAELSSILALEGVLPAHVNETLTHIATIAENPTIPVALQALTTAHSSGGPGLASALLVGIGAFFPTLFPGVQIVSLPPATGPASVLTLPQSI